MFLPHVNMSILEVRIYVGCVGYLTRLCNCHQSDFSTHIYCTLSTFLCARRNYAFYIPPPHPTMVTSTCLCEHTTPTVQSAIGALEGRQHQDQMLAYAYVLPPQGTGTSVTMTQKLIDN